MKSNRVSQSEIAQMVRLAAPIMMAELGWMAMGIVDTMFVGRVSAEALGAISLGTIVFYGVGMTAAGLLLGLDTLVSQSFGAGDKRDCRKSLIASLWLALLLLPLVMGSVFAILPLLAHWGVDRGVLRETGPYVTVLAWSAPPLLLYFALRRYLQATNRARPVMAAFLLANVVNLIGNWLFVAGNVGVPKMGASGAAWATLVSRVVMATVLMWVLWKEIPDLEHDSWAPDWLRVKELLRLGGPAAGQIAFEVAVFAVVTVLVSKTTAAALAGHQIALTTVSTTFMMPLGISSAAAVRVGHALGRKDAWGASRAGWTALGLGASVMGTAGFVLLVFPMAVARLFTTEPEVLTMGAALLRIAAFFQLFDGLQVVATGALRGAGDTRMPMLAHFTGYWAIGLPAGAYLCFSKGWGAPGLWAGLSGGLILIGIFLTLVWRSTSAKLR
jgi:MATE family multidrug resistance protein